MSLFKVNQALSLNEIKRKYQLKIFHVYVLDLLNFSKKIIEKVMLEQMHYKILLLYQGFP